MTRSPSRIAFTAVLALTLVTVSGLSQVLRPRPRAHVASPPSVESVGWKGAALRKESVELSVRDDVRQQCEGHNLPPEPFVLERFSSAQDLTMLEGLAHCLSEGPLSGVPIELLGASELPGAVDGPADASGSADLVRSLLVRLGVPMKLIQTHDLGDTGGAHDAPRVVLGVATVAGGEETP